MRIHRLLVAGLLVPAAVSSAQPLGDCGTALTPEQFQQLVAIHKDDGDGRDPALDAGQPYFIPISFHVVRRSDGSGGIDEGQLAAALSLANAAFAGAGMAFCQFGPVLYVDSDFYYFQPLTSFDIYTLWQIGSVPNTVNVYLLPFLTVKGQPLCGLATYSFVSNGGIAMRYSCMGTATQGSSFPHELGHYFDLFHTHEGTQCTSGAGCATTGDLICDTPPDPTLGTHNVVPGCIYVGNEPDPCGSSTPYAPLVNNFMSYAPGPCRHQFTVEQLTRARSTLINERPELALPSCPIATGPSADLSRVSVGVGNLQTNGHSSRATVSANGRFVVFASQATNLDPRDTSPIADIFIRDRLTNTTELVSVSLSNTGGNGPSDYPSVSADGRFVAFDSAATNLVSGQAIPFRRIYLRDRQTQQTALISMPHDGTAIANESQRPLMTPSGSHIAFVSYMSNLVPGDNNKVSDIFVYDRQSRTISRVSVASNGEEANGASPATFDGRIAISSNGQLVAFSSNATNLIADDTNGGFGDVFLRDATAGQTTVVGVNSAGQQADFGSDMPAMSGDGRFVVFHSAASNLAPDPNGLFADAFLHDRQNGTTVLLGVDASGQQYPLGSSNPSISSSGRRVAFQRPVSVGGNPQNNDLIMRDLVSGQYVHLNPSIDGLAATVNTRLPDISAGGNVAVYQSDAANLVLNDTNQRSDIFAFALPGIPIAPGDINADGHVNVDDLLAVILNWGPCPGKAGCPADVTGDGAVNVDDLLAVIVAWDP